MSGGGRLIGGGGDRLFDLFDPNDDIEDGVEAEGGLVGLGCAATVVSAEEERTGGYECEFIEDGSTRVADDVDASDLFSLPLLC
jgi:hypothetical protein